MTVTDLPTLNASLNALSTVLLTAGWYFIRTKQRNAHRLSMLMAVGVSAAFLTSYLIYHYYVGSVAFTGTGALRVVYFTILISHVVLAAAIVPMIVISLSRALSSRFDQHRRIARWTMPLWLYVSVTGVVVYWMLYRL